MGTAKRALDVLQDYHAEHRAMPSFGALAKLVGVSVSTVADAVTRLKSEGFLRASDTGRLQPGSRFFERQLLGSVQAGTPVAVADTPADGLLIDEYLVDAPTRTMLLTVRGDSMRDAGLLPGDVVVVKRGALAVANDIVVAMLNGECTVKQLAHEKGGLYLRACNPEYVDIHPAVDCEIIGVVVGQFRKYVKSTVLSKRHG